jgi:hypothetical protein
MGKGKQSLNKMYVSSFSKIAAIKRNMALIV